MPPTAMLLFGGVYNSLCMFLFLPPTAPISQNVNEACTHSFYQILKTVEYMHQKHVCHRNLSTDAVVLHGKEGFFVE